MYAAQPRLISINLLFKRIFYHCCKRIGLFHLSGRLTRRGLRIVSYHGFSVADECEFSPRTFIRPVTFQKRMAFLERAGFSVLGLDRALDLLDEGTLPPRALVITIDDGFASLYSRAYPTLAKYSFPATIYVTTYYAERKNPIFKITVQYMFWKTRRKMIDLTGLGISRSGIVSLATEAEKSDRLWEILNFGDTACNEEGRVALCRKLGDLFDVDYDSIAQSRMFTILALEEIRELSKAGIDIQLHAHRHRFPRDRAIAMQEIADNRRVLEPLVTKPLVHFCYPSGVWSREQWPWLSEAGIRSAVTCDFGYNYRETPKYGLRRFGDSEGLSQIEFEAELCGFAQILRRMQRKRPAAAV